MGKELAVVIPEFGDRSHDGKAMRALNDSHHDFVLAMITQKPHPKAPARAAEAVGLAPRYGYQLMRDERILAALREEATKRIAGAALFGVDVMLEIAADKSHKDRYKAAKDLAALNGFNAEQRIVVEHVTEDTKALIAQIKTMAQELGLDPQKLIRQAGIIEGEFTEVEEIEAVTEEPEDGDGA